MKKKSYNELEREKILNSLSKVSSSTKKKILEDSKKPKKIHNKNSGRTTSLGTLKYDVNDYDVMHIKFIKERINELNIEPEFVYKRLVEIYNCDYEKAKSDGYNLIYTLRKGILSFTRFYLWLKILKITEFEFKYKSEYFDSDEEDINEDDIDIDEDYYEE